MDVQYSAQINPGGTMSVLVHVAENVRRHRQAAELSQQALADAAGVSRRMLVGIESGEANVSLNVLDRIAEALGVRFADLVQAPSGTRSRIQAVAWRGQHPDSSGVLLASQASNDEIELWAWTLMPGDGYHSAANPVGWHEMIYVIEGELTLRTGNGSDTIAATDFRVYPSDQDVEYRNEGQAVVRFVRNVIH